MAGSKVNAMPLPLRTTGKPADGSLSSINGLDRKVTDFGTATAKVFSITELRELILYYVPGCYLLVQRRTCRAFDDMVRNSPLIETRLFRNAETAIQRPQIRLNRYVWANDIVFRPRESIRIRGITPRRARYFEFRMRGFRSDLMRLLLPSTTSRPILLINLTLPEAEGQFQNCLQTQWASGFVTGPPLPVTLRIYMSEADAYWQYATVEVQPATFQQLFMIALLVRRTDQMASYSGEYKDLVGRGWIGTIQKCKWSKKAQARLFRESTQEQRELLRLLKSRPVYFESENKNALDSLQKSGFLIR